MRKHLLLTLATMITLLATAGLLRAIAGPSPIQQAPAGPDAQFMMRAAQGGMAEVELSELAMQKSANENVRAAAQKIAADHEKANTELKTLAESKEVTLPAKLDAEHQDIRDRLDKMSGAEFDRGWAEQMVKDHEMAIELFTKHSKSGADAEVRAFAAKQLPALRAHLKQAQALVKASAPARGRR